MVLLEDQGAAEGSLIHNHLSVSRHRAETGHFAARTCRENLQLSTGRRAKPDALGPAESTWGLVIGKLVPVLRATFSKPLPYVNPLRSSPVKWSDGFFSLLFLSPLFSLSLLFFETGSFFF